MYSIIFYTPLAAWEEGSFFDGWTHNAVILSILGSAGGLLVALTMKYTDAVLKTFATSGAIIVTAIGGHFMMDSPLDIPIGVGAGCTVLSLLNYSDDGSAAAAAAAAPGPASTQNGDVSKASLVGGKALANGTAEDDEATQSLMTRNGTPNVPASTQV